MLQVADGKFGALQQSSVRSPNSLRQCAAVCNSLSMIHSKDIIGDVADSA